MEQLSDQFKTVANDASQFDMVGNAIGKAIKAIVFGFRCPFSPASGRSRTISGINLGIGRVGER